MAKHRLGRVRTMPPGTELFHVHRQRYDALDFNPHSAPDDSWRFSPLIDSSGARVSSWYGALASEGALYETVFRDIYSRRKAAIDRDVVLVGRMVSKVILKEPVRLLELYGDGLVTLRLKTSFTTSEPRSYPRSRRIAQALYDEYPEAQGFIWRSRINNDHFSVVVYGDRATRTFATVVENYPLDSGRGLIAVMKVATAIGCAVN